MVTYNSILLTLVIEGLTKSYIVPKTIKKYNLQETGTFYTLLLLLAGFSVFEFFFLSKCINSESMKDVFGNHPMLQVVILLVVSLIVNYGWVMAIYDKFSFWPTIGILSLVSFVNEFNNTIITSTLQSISGEECSY
jgi:hypothetical protein